MAHDIQGGHALITGASRGIGVHIARAFSQRGYKLSLVARSIEGLEKTAALLSRSGVSIELIAADLADSDARRQLLERATQAHGPIDVLVNNAGLYEPGLLEARDDAAIEAELQLNLHALIYLSKAVLPAMRARGHGAIVNMSSLAGLVGAAYSEVYSASKFGVVGFTRALRASLAQEGQAGIQVVSVCPGYVSEVGMFQDYAQQYEISAPTWMGTSHPDAVAQAVIEALVSRAPELIVNPGPMRLGLSLAALFPRIMEWVYLKLGAHRTLGPVVESGKHEERAKEESQDG